MTMAEATLWPTPTKTARQTRHIKKSLVVELERLMKLELGFVGTEVHINSSAFQQYTATWTESCQICYYQ